jgi:hypothetical protein
MATENEPKVALVSEGKITKTRKLEITEDETKLILQILEKAQFQGTETLRIALSLWDKIRGSWGL